MSGASIAVTGGKGGVGKTHLAANLAYRMTQHGRSVLLVDADLGLASLDVLLGLTTHYDVADVLAGRCAPEDALLSGPGGVQILPARSGARNLAELSPSQRDRLAEVLTDLAHGYDVVLFDTAAGISSVVMFALELAERALVVTTPEPTALTDAYALIKVGSAAGVLDHCDLVMNLYRTPDEEFRASAGLQKTLKRFLDRTVPVRGSVPMDGSVPRAVRQRRLVSERYPDAPASQRVEALARSLLGIDASPPSPRKAT